MELRQAQVLLAVLEHGSVTAAGTALGMSTSGVSDVVRAVEREAGTPLFHRDARGLRANSAGQALGVGARRLLRDADTIRAVAGQLSGQLRGRLDIAALGEPVEALRPVLVAFRHRHPDVRVRLHTPLLESDLITAIEHGHAELGLLPLAHGEPPALTGATFLAGRTDDELRLALPPGTGLELPDPLPVADLPDLPTIAVTSGSPVRLMVEGLLRRTGVRPRLGVVTTERTEQVALVLTGVGMAFVGHEQALSAARAGATVRRLTPSPAVQYGVLRRHGHPSPEAVAFLELLPTPSTSRSVTL